MKYKITLKNQFKALEFILFVLLFCSGCIFYFKRTNPAFHTEYFIWLFLIQFIPVLFLHIEYLILNRTSSLTINDVHQIAYTDQSSTVEIHEDEIAGIFLFLPPSAYRDYVARKMQLLPIEPYGYAIIYTKDGDKIIITSLMISDLFEEFSKFKNVTIEKKRRIIASPILEKVIQWFSKDGL
jgi:hypothetical protein